MSKYSLVPERQLLFSPGLAETIGLEEAILVQHLKNLFDYHIPTTRNGYSWLKIMRVDLINNLPFWNNTTLNKIIRSLVDKGVILVDTNSNYGSQQIIFAMNETNSVVNTHRELQTQKSGQATLLSSSWLPSEDLLLLLEINHSIPRRFAEEQLEDFLLYWRERGDKNHAWSNKYRQHVLSRWRKYQLDQNSPLENKRTKKLTQKWQPSSDALDILTKAGIDPTFIDDALPEFILYWCERDSSITGINSKFIQHIRLQWSRYKDNLDIESQPTKIGENWEPSADLFDILKLAHIDAEFAKSVIPEFILYWRENGGIHKSWNSKFLQHVKYHWARQHQMNQLGRAHEKDQKTDSTRRTRDRSIQEDLRDTTWAD